MDAKNAEGREVMISLMKNKKRIYKTVLLETDTLEGVYKELIEAKKISSDDILVDQEGSELDIKRMKVKFLEDGVICLKSEFQDEPKPVIEEDKPIKPEIGNKSSVAVNNFNFSTKNKNPNDIEWSDLKKEDQLLLVQNLCKYGYFKLSHENYKFAKPIWTIVAIPNDAVMVSYKQTGKFWNPKVTINLDLCPKELTPEFRDYFMGRRENISVLNLIEFYREFGEVLPTSVEIGAINMSQISDEQKWRKDFNTSRLSDIIKAFISTENDASTEIHYNWAITNIPAVMDNLDFIINLIPEGKSITIMRPLLRVLKQADGIRAKVTIQGNEAEKTYNNGKYKGEMKDGKQYGVGTYTWAEGGTYHGEHKDDMRQGCGIYTWADGNRYEGEYKSNLKEGYGIFYWKLGDRYEGQWKSDKKHGYGRFFWKNGEIYSGMYSDDKRNGKGVYHWTDGNRFEGEYKDNVKCGHGIFYWKNGERYEGEYKEDVRNGKGVYFWNDGSRYEGEFKNNKLSGAGKYVWANGERFEGTWVDDKKHGSGIFYSANGERFQQVWENGVKASSVKLK